jgi:hypothetical protein
MRRKSGLILLALAVFFAALSPLLRWYAFPRLAKVPANAYQDMVLEARNATLLDYGTMTARTVPKVTIVQTLKGNVEESERIERTAGRDVVVWDGLSYVQGPDGKMVSRIPERYIFDAHTQEPVHATGEMVDGHPVRREGLEFKWPFRTEKRDYEYFDAQARVTAPIHYKGTEKFRGLEVYYFEQTIPWTQVAMPRTMPVAGITPETVARTGTTRWYTTVRRFWVEPVTGAPVYGEEIHRRPRQGDGLRRPREDARGLHRAHRRPGRRQPHPGAADDLLPALGVPHPRCPPPRPRAVRGGPRPTPRRAGTGPRRRHRTGHRLSRALVCRVGSAPAGSSGHGCLGYRPRSSARTPL